MNPGGRIATQRTLTGQPLPTITFLLASQPYHHTHTPPHGHSQTPTPTAGVCDAHIGVHSGVCCCGGRGAPGAVGGGVGVCDDVCVVKSGSSASGDTSEHGATLECGAVPKEEGDMLTLPHTDPRTPESDCVGRRGKRGSGVSRDVSVEVAQGGSNLVVDECMAVRHGVRDSARRALVKRVSRESLKEQLDNESKDDRSSVMRMGDSSSQRSQCRKRRTLHCPDASPDAVRTRLSAHAVDRDVAFTTGAKVGRVEDVDGQKDREGGPDHQLVGLVRSLCVVSPELLRHVVSFIITPLPK